MAVGKEKINPIVVAVRGPLAVAGVGRVEVGVKANQGCVGLSSDARQLPQRRRGDLTPWKMRFVTSPRKLVKKRGGN